MAEELLGDPNQESMPLDAPSATPSQSLLDQHIQENPHITQKIMEGVFMSPQAAYKHWYGEDVPMMSGISPSYLSHVETHSKLRQSLMEDVLNNITNPAYGRSVGEGSKLLGMEPSEFASPEQYKLTPQPDIVPRNVDIPPTFDIDQLQKPTKRMSTGLYPQDVMTQGSREDLRMAQPPSREVDVNAPMNAMQRAEVAATIKRMGSPWYGGSRGKAANAAAMSQQYYDALQRYGPDDPRTMVLGAQAGLIKSTAQSGSTEQKLSEARTRKVGAQATTEEAKADVADERQQAELANVRARTAATENRTQLAQGESIALRRLRDAQAALAEAKMKGNIPEREMQAHEANVKTAQKKYDLLANYMVLLNKAGEGQSDARDLAQQFIEEEAGIGREQAPPGVKESIRSTLGMKPGYTATREGVQTHVPGITEQGTLPNRTAGEALDELSKSINELLQKKGVDPEQAKQEGVKYQGQVYQFKDGRWVK